MQKPNTKQFIEVMKENKEGLTLSDIEMQLNWFHRSDIENLIKKSKNLGYSFKVDGKIISLDTESGKVKEDKDKRVNDLIESARKKNLPSKVEVL